MGVWSTNLLSMATSAQGVTWTRSQPTAGGTEEGCCPRGAAGTAVVGGGAGSVDGGAAMDVTGGSVGNTEGFGSRLAGGGEGSGLGGGATGEGIVIGG